MGPVWKWGRVGVDPLSLCGGRCSYVRGGGDGSSTLDWVGGCMALDATQGWIIRAMRNLFSFCGAKINYIPNSIRKTWPSSFDDNAKKKMHPTINDAPLSLLVKGKVRNITQYFVNPCPLATTCTLLLCVQIHSLPVPSHPYLPTGNLQLVEYFDMWIFWHVPNKTQWALANPQTRMICYFSFLYKYSLSHGHYLDHPSRNNLDLATHAGFSFLRIIKCAQVAICISGFLCNFYGRTSYILVTFGLCCWQTWFFKDLQGGFFFLIKSNWHLPKRIRT